MAFRTALGATLVSALIAVPLAVGLTPTATADPDTTPSTGVSAKRQADASGARVLAKPSQGRAALDASRVPVSELAERNGISTAELRKTLLHDEAAWLSTEGKLFYAESWGKEATSAADRVADAAIFPLADTFNLSSLPGSKHTVYLDFDGYTLPSGVAWASNGISPNVAFRAFDERETSGGQSYDAAFTDDEKAYIQQTWQVVAEKFAPFDVNVTTKVPADPAEAFNRTDSSDDTWGSRVVFTDDPAARPSASCPFNNGCAGIAWRDTFNTDENGFPAQGYHEPTWVYTTLASGGTTFQQSATEAGETAAHEVGHNFDLQHDGVSGGDDYFDGAGHGNWFPIMGSSLRAVGQWSQGEYDGANNNEDDTAMIAAHGAPLRSDDAGSTFAQALDLAQQPSYALRNQVISTRADKDVYLIDRSTCTGNLIVTATGIGAGQALDIDLKVFNAAQALVGGDNPTSSQTASYPFTPTGMDAEVELPAATPQKYYVQVDGVGRGSAATNGYSDYGSLGYYDLDITGCSGSAGTAPDAPSAVNVSTNPRSSTGTLTWGLPASPGSSAITGYRITGLPTGTVDVAASPRSRALTGLVPGNDYTVRVAAKNAAGTGDFTTFNLSVPTYTPSKAPGLVLKPVGRTLEVSWTAPANPGNATFKTWRVTVGGQDFDSTYGQYTGIDLSPFRNGTYSVRLQLLMTADQGPAAPSITKKVTIGAGAPKIGTASSGAKRKPVNATVRWGAAAANGSAITSYKLVAYKLNAKGKVTRTYTKVRPASARSYTWALPAGRYKFRVVASNKLGSGPYSGYSKIVRSR